jgi:PPOX class probable FMN-dependent enzyme
MIDSIASLRGLYAEPTERARRKQLSRLDEHCLRFVGLSPFVVLASGSAEGQYDASPRGGDPGFVKAPDAQTLLVPDASGNNRLDTLQNIIATGRVGLLFLVPGVDETLRVNGRARLDTGPELMAHFAGERRAPKIVIEVKVEDAYLHCAKAFMRSRLWDPATHVERSTLPSMGQMIADQIGTPGAGETQEQMVARYKADI